MWVLFRVINFVFLVRSGTERVVLASQDVPVPLGHRGVEGRDRVQEQIEERRSQAESSAVAFRR